MRQTRDASYTGTRRQLTCTGVVDYAKMYKLIITFGFEYSYNYELSIGIKIGDLE